jgi:hypothetical protein
MPLEVSACLSYHGSAEGVPAARQRGRVYIGPLQTQVLTVSSGVPEPIMLGELIDTLVTKGQNLAGNGALADDGWHWAVYSRVNELAYNITGGWVDNEFDTQRRRQADPTQRVLWTAP